MVIYQFDDFFKDVTYASLIVGVGLGLAVVESAAGIFHLRQSLFALFCVDSLELCLLAVQLNASFWHSASASASAVASAAAFDAFASLCEPNPLNW